MGKWTRRAFIAAGSLAGGGLLLGVGAFAFAPNRLRIGRREAPGLHGLNTWVAIDTQGGIRVVVPHAELGQGTHTALAMMLVDELDGDWSRVSIEEAPATGDFANGSLAYVFLPLKGRIRAMQRGYDYLSYRAARRWGLQPTGGSTSVRATGQHAMRVAGAAARQMLVRAAAQRWNVPVGDCTTALSVVHHEASARAASFAELAEAAAQLNPSAAPALKSPAQFRLMGRPVRRLDVPAKVNGAARYGIDAMPEDLLFAAVRRAPVAGTKLLECDASAAEAMSGVRRVVLLDDAVAVVADNTFVAQRALDALRCRFSSDPVRDALSSAGLRALQAQALQQGPFSATLERGDIAAALERSGARAVRARYEVPFLSHAPLEPMSATARLRDGGMEIWTSVQDPLNAAYVVAQDLGIERNRVMVRHGLVGGGFGRRLPGRHDYVLQAARIARELTPRPVKLVWSRTEDLTQGFFRPAIMADLAGSPGEGASLAAWQMTCTGGAESEAGQPLYAAPAMAVRFAAVPHHIRTGPWRSVGHSQCGFFIESFIDELAAAAGVDPLQYRLALLPDEPRARAVLERAAEMAGWGRALPPDRGLGVAMVRSFETYVAQVAEVEVQRGADGRPTGLRVPRVFAAVDCGLLVNPLSAEAQVQGAVVMGLSAALGESISIEAGAVRETNFHQYPLLRMPDAPRVEVSFLPSSERPGGLGEPGLPPIAPAVANAWFAATGQRLRRLPFLAALLPEVSSGAQ